MSDIDTAAIRAGVVDNPALAMTILDLCDALDAARADLEDLRRDIYWCLAGDPE